MTAPMAAQTECESGAGLSQFSEDGLRSIEADVASISQTRHHCIDFGTLGSSRYGNVASMK